MEAREEMTEPRLILISVFQMMFLPQKGKLD